MSVTDKIASALLQIKAIKLEPQTPFRWASGWLSPIYCDNRLTLSYPEIRSEIADELATLIAASFPSAQGIAAVATGAIPHGTLVANRLGWPMVYVRSAAKEHGMGNLVEGVFQPGQRLVVVEDLISTGKSSLKAVEALRAAGAEVCGMVAIFTYGFDAAETAFEKAGCKLFTLTNYETVIRIAGKENALSPQVSDTLLNWRKNPDSWKP